MQSSALLERTVAHLARLVAFDTCNPPRNIDTGGIVEYLRENLCAQGCEAVPTDHGAGAVSLFAHRGAPKVLFNVHIDTVPPAPGWTHHPLTLRIDDDRAVGLGAADIKGAAAALLAAIELCSEPVAVLFSSDEEANDSRCVAAFLSQQHGFREVVVAEPTGCQAVLAHRGIVSGVIRFEGIAGHAAEARALSDNAIHRACEWAHAVLDDVRRRANDSFAELVGFRFSLGTIHGGIKNNVIAPDCEVRFNSRPLPTEAAPHIERWLKSRVAAGTLAGFEFTFTGPCLPAHPEAALITIDTPEVALAKAEALAKRLGLQVGPAVDFWTEAALFSAAGLTAMVFGPGHIAQAHGKDEWVTLRQLSDASDHYLRMIRDGLV